MKKQPAPQIRFRDKDIYKYLTERGINPNKFAADLAKKEVFQMMRAEVKSKQKTQQDSRDSPPSGSGEAAKRVGSRTG